MRVLVQRVKSAAVTVDDATIGEIGQGLLLLVGFGAVDDVEQLTSMAGKIANLRIFSDARGRFHHSLNDTGGEVLVVPQFTLYADTSKGRRPEFLQAMAPEKAADFFNQFVEKLQQTGIVSIATGRFGAHMAVQSVNDGPVTLMLEQ